MNSTSLHILFLTILFLVIQRLQNVQISFYSILFSLLLAAVLVYMYMILYPSDSLAIEYKGMIDRKQDARVDFLRSVGFPV